MAGGYLWAMTETVSKKAGFLQKWEPACQPQLSAVLHKGQRASQLCFSNWNWGKILNPDFFERNFLPAHGHCVIPGHAAADSDATPLLFPEWPYKFLHASTNVVAHVFSFQSLSNQVIFTPP